MQRWLGAGLCGVVAVRFLVGCSAVADPEVEESLPTLDPRGYEEKTTRAPLTFDLLVNALPLATDEPLGLPYWGGCPDATKPKCEDVDVVVNDWVSRAWEPTRDPDLPTAWMAPHVILQVIAFPDVTGPIQRVEDTRVINSPRFHGSFDIAAVPGDDGTFTPGFRGEGLLEDVMIAGWTGVVGRSEQAYTNLDGDVSALYHSDVLAIRAGRFSISCYSTDLSPNENGDVCMDLVTEIVAKIEER